MDSDYKWEIYKKLITLLYEHIEKQMKEPTYTKDQERLPCMIELLASLLRI